MTITKEWSVTDSWVKTIARVCHEANRAYCVSLGDHSQAVWESAPEWQQRSAINGVKYHLANDDSTDADSHAMWMAEKAEQGWVYGEAKDADAKTHPCLVPFDELPAEQQAKDRIFLAIVRAME